jgi:outer membrane protein
VRRQRLVCAFNDKSQTGIPKEFSIQMKRTFALVLMLASGIVLSAAAQTQAAPTAAAPAVPAKIAVVAFQLAVAQTNEGQRDFGDLQKKYAPKEAALKTLSDEVDNLTKQLQAQGATLSQAEQANKAKVIDEKKKQLDRDSEDARNDFQADIQEMYNALASKVYDVMSTYAEHEGFTLVLDISQQQTPVLFSANGTNITKQVIDAYNVKSGVPAPPPQPAGAPGSQAAPKAPATRPAPQRQPATH